MPENGDEGGRGWLVIINIATPNLITIAVNKYQSLVQRYPNADISILTINIFILYIERTHQHHHLNHHDHNHHLNHNLLEPYPPSFRASNVHISITILTITTIIIISTTISFNHTRLHFVHLTQVYHKDTNGNPVVSLLNGEEYHDGLPHTGRVCTGMRDV